MKVKKISLNGLWNMRKKKEAWQEARVPGSVYSNLLEQHKMENPYWGENEHEAAKMSEEDYDFKRIFIMEESQLGAEEITMVFEGIDTIAEVYLNGSLLLSADNMHRTYRIPVKEHLKCGENELLVQFHSPLQYIRKKNEARKIWGVDSTVEGFSQIRKAHYMFGWDWGPVLPDMGIFRDVSLELVWEGQIQEASFRQEHRRDDVILQCTILNQWTQRIACEDTEKKCRLRMILTAPDKSQQVKEWEATSEMKKSVTIEQPMLWWPNGLGEQNLYTIKLQLLLEEEMALEEGTVLDEKTYRIGLRTLTVSREKDQWGEEFCFCVNGNKIFAMGADYIPEDNIVPFQNYERTCKLIETCREANYNCIRVWGGGFYLADYFYDLCDENGLIVWQDFMYACASYWLTDDFKRTIIAETRDNIKRIRHHASLGLWCGNNEMESAWVGWGIPQEEDLKNDYLEMFEDIIPALCEQLDPDTFYWPSSPSSGGNFKNTSSPDSGDQHYWDVWHGMKPITEFEKYFFRFCSEYGFVSLPSVKTIQAFAEKSQQNLCSPVLELHHRCGEGNKKMLYYISQVMRYPDGLKQLVYASQLLQADAIRANVEHMRRNRGRCMGSVYWQVNDSNPCISWSSIDYYGRWKALQYYAKKFYSPISASFVMDDNRKVTFYVTNETRKNVKGQLVWRLRDAKANIITEGNCLVELSMLCTKTVGTVELADQVNSLEQKRSRYMEYELQVDGNVVSNGDTLFVPCKEFDFVEPQIQWQVQKKEKDYVLEFWADAYVKGLYLELRDCDVIFSDNWFDINGQEKVTITISAKEAAAAGIKDEAQIKEQLQIMSAAEIGRA